MSKRRKRGGPRSASGAGPPPASSQLIENKHPDKIVLLSVGDGPEGIEIYTSEHEGVSDWSPAFPAVYVTVAVHDAFVKLGPFTMPKIYEQLMRQLVARV